MVATFFESAADVMEIIHVVSSLAKQIRTVGSAHVPRGLSTADVIFFLLELGNSQLVSCKQGPDQ